MKFTIIIEDDGNNHFGAYSPEVPGCFAVGGSVEETKKRMEEAIAFHLEGLTPEERDEIKQNANQNTSYHISYIEVA